MPLTISGAEGTFLRMKKHEDTMPISVEPVKLKPLFGMEPGVYLTILYLTILLIVLFLVAVLPGILHSGKQVTFTSRVEPSIVTVDGTYIGSAPVTAFIEPGSHEVTFSYEGVDAVTTSFEVSHPIFLTWLFPRRQEVSSGNYIKDISAFEKYIDAMYDQVVAWSVINDFNEVYHRPPLFKQVATTAVALDFQRVEVVLNDFFTQSLNYITSKAMLEDYQEALTIIREQSILGESEITTLSQQMEKITTLFNEDQSNTNIGTTVAFEQVSSQRVSLEIPIPGVSPITGFSYENHDLVVGKQVVERYPGVHELAMEMTVGSFTIGALEISEYLWAHFIDANPYWSKGNIDNLLADGMVDEMYLAGVYPTTSIISNQPIRNISWYAATAFTEWLGQITGERVFLPTNSQWEAAARSVSGKSFQKGTIALVERDGPSSMLGGYWEFTSESFVPLARYTGIEPSKDSFASDIVIKGGSYLNDPAGIDRATIGVSSRNSCSETTGFRVAWFK